jgi:archaellum biogenesis protein FlaJ (TadC family)
MFNYALVRNRFSSDIYASLVTSAIFLGMSFLVFANLTNLGIFSIEMCCTSFLFNLIELPPSILLGAVIYKQG